MTPRQIKVQSEKREKELWALIEDVRKTKYTSRQRALYENKQGIEALIEDDVSDEVIRAGLSILDDFQSKNFTVLKFYGWLPNLQAKHSKGHQQNREPDVIIRPANSVRSFNGIAAQAQAQAQAQSESQRRQDQTPPAKELRRA